MRQDPDHPEGFDRRETRRRPAPSRRARSSRRKRQSPLGMVAEVMIIVVAAFALAMVVQFFFIKPFTIHQISMEPTLLEGDRILLNRMVYHFRDPKSGDVVVFDSPVHQREDLVKRVVAVGGDLVAVQQGVLYVNGVPRPEPYLGEQSPVIDFPEEEIPPDYVFVLGDNRDNSGDSRIFGAVPIDALIGKAFAIYWPIGRWSGL